MCRKSAQFLRTLFAGVMVYYSYLQFLLTISSLSEVCDMQLFSQYLRDLLQAKGLTVSALSRLSGMERTALSKTLTGQRVLPYAALDDLL